jgi:hypothetical protein
MGLVLRRRALSDVKDLFPIRLARLLTLGRNLWGNCGFRPSTPLLGNAQPALGRLSLRLHIDSVPLAEAGDRLRWLTLEHH